MGLDIGADSAARYTGLVAAAATVFWNGPMGRFELPQYTAGTRAIADAVASTSAMLEFLEGRPLPGVQVLLRRDR